jgi:hypothetical protein
MTIRPDELKPFERVRALHKQLLAHIPTYTGEELARPRERDPAAAGERHRALRESHQIFGVPLGDTWHYPRFQFDTRGRPSPHAAELLEALGTSADPWDVLRWFIEPNQKLDGAPPFEHWNVDPGSVIEIARRSH